MLFRSQHLFLGFALSAVMLAACGKKEEPAPSSAAPAGDPATAAVQYDDEKVLNIYNWPDYIAESVIPDFEKATGIKVNFQTFENGEALHAKLVAGNTGYDIVVPGTALVGSEVSAGFFQPLDRAMLPNYGNLEPAIMQKLAVEDTENKHLVPWAWGLTTVGINRTKLEKALGGMPMPANAWDLVFNPEYTSKAKSCGIAFLDSPVEVMPPALHYLGVSHNKPSADEIKKASDLLAKVRKDIRIFSSTMIDDIAGGKACVVLGWSGDINIAAQRSKDNGSSDVIEALLPSTGALFFGDSIAITKDAKHPKNAHAFINYYLSKEVAALQTNEMSYHTANTAAMELIKPEQKDNKTIFLDADNMGKMFFPGGYPIEVREQLNNAYTAFKKG